MTASAQSCLVIVTALALGACQSPFNGADDALTVQGAHPIAVEKRLVSAPFAVGSDATAVSIEDSDRAHALMADYRARGLGKLAIASPSGTSNSAAAIQFSAQLTEIARREGVDTKLLDIASYRAASNEQAPPLIVSYTVYEARPSPCGDYSRNAAFAPLNQMMPDFGCATQHNLAAMVENPRDLVTPRDEGAPDQARRATVFDYYRKGESTAAKSAEDAKGAVSEVK